MAKEVSAAYFNKRNEESQTRKTGGGGDFNNWKPEAGKFGEKPFKNVIRFLPPHDNMPDDGFMELKMHFLPSNELDDFGKPKPIGIMCLTYYGEDCPSCTFVDSLYKQSRASEDKDEGQRIKEQAYERRAQLRFGINLVDMNHPEKGVQRWFFGVGIEKQIRACFYDDDGEFRNISHPQTGRDIILQVVKKSAGKNAFNEYPTVKAKDAPSKLQDMDWLEKIQDLSLEAKKPTKAEHEQALKGIRPGAEKKPGAAAPVAAEKPKPSARVETPPKKKAPEPVEEVEETEEEVVAEVEEEEVEETPAPTPAPKAAKPAAKPAPKEAPVAVKKPARQPVEETAEEVDDDSDDPYAQARRMIDKAGLEFTPIEITPEETERVKKPACFTKETDINDTGCQGCRVLLPCLTAKAMSEE